MTICRAQRGTKLRHVSCQNKARSTRLRFRTLPIHPTSKPERPGVTATDLWASAASDPHTVRSRLSEPSGGGLVRGAGSRWCCHLLGTSSYDPYAAYVSGRHAAEPRGGVRRPRTEPTVLQDTGRERVNPLPPPGYRLVRDRRDADAATRRVPRLQSAVKKAGRGFVEGSAYCDVHAYTRVH